MDTSLVRSSLNLRKYSNSNIYASKKYSDEGPYEYTKRSSIDCLPERSKKLRKSKSFQREGWPEISLDESRSNTVLQEFRNII